MFFIDTNVFVYAGSANVTYRPGSELILRAIERDANAGTTSTAVVEELWHLDLARRLPAGGNLARAAFTLMRPVLAVTDEILADALGAVDLSSPLGANDRLHVSTCRLHGISQIVTADRGFEDIPGLRRIDPADLPGVRSLVG